MKEFLVKKMVTLVENGKLRVEDIKDETYKAEVQKRLSE